MLIPRLNNLTLLRVDLT